MARTFLLTILATCLVTAGYFYFTTSKAIVVAENNSGLQFASAANALAPAAGTPPAAKVEIGSEFTLTDQNGNKVTSEDLKGRKLLVFFGFTNCTDVCPLTMAVITEVMNQLESANIKNVQPVFITVDPKRDKPAVIKEYLKDYYPGFIGLTGTKEEIDKVKKGYKVFASEAKATHDEPGDHDEYNVSHSDLIYYMDQNGKYISHFNRDNAPEDIVEYINNH